MKNFIFIFALLISINAFANKEKLKIVVENDTSVCVYEKESVNIRFIIKNDTVYCEKTIVDKWGHDLVVNAWIDSISYCDTVRSVLSVYPYYTAVDSIITLKKSGNTIIEETVHFNTIDEDDVDPFPLLLLCLIVACVLGLILVD